MVPYTSLNCSQVTLSPYTSFATTLAAQRLPLGEAMYWRWVTSALFEVMYTDRGVRCSCGAVLASKLSRGGRLSWHLSSSSTAFTTRALSSNHWSVPFIRQPRAGDEFRANGQLLEGSCLSTAPIDNSREVVLVVKEHIARMQVEMAQREGTPDSVLDDDVAQGRFEYPACRQPFWVIRMHGHYLSILGLSLVIEILERGFQGPGRRMPGHCNDLNWLLGIFSAPKTPDAAECQILKLSSRAWCGILATQYVESENANSRTRLWKPEVNCDTLTVHLTWGDRFGSCFLRDSTPRFSRYLKFAEEMRVWIRLYLSDSGCKLENPCQWSLGFSISQKDED